METHRWARVWGFLLVLLRPEGEPAPYLFRPLGPHSQRCVPQFAVALTSGVLSPPRPSLSCGGLAKIGPLFLPSSGLGMEKPVVLLLLSGTG